MRTLPPDQLIINQDGSIYHLDIRPEQLADTIVTVGDPQRVELVSQFFDEIEFTNSHREFVIKTGSLGGKRITAMSTGMGTQNMDVVMNELDALANIDFSTRKIKDNHKSLSIYRFGTCGAIQEEIGPGEFIVATHGLDLTGVMSYYADEQYHQEKELAKVIRDYLDIKYPHVPVHIYQAENKLIEPFRQHPDYHMGITATCNGFYGAQGRELRLASSVNGMTEYLGQFLYNHHKIMNLEMETGCLYGFGKLLNHKCCTVNVTIANRMRNTFKLDVHSAEIKLIEQTLEIILSSA